MDKENIGTIKIADDVVSTIAGIAATEVDGVSRLVGGITKDDVAKTSKRTLSKGVSAVISHGDVTVDLSYELSFGFSVKKVSEDVQNKVKQAIETMTGLHVSRVNVVVSGISADRN